MPKPVLTELLASSALATAPAYSFASATNTGMYLSGTELAFSVSGTQRMALTDVGRLNLFGTTSFHPIVTVNNNVVDSNPPVIRGQKSRGAGAAALDDRTFLLAGMGFDGASNFFDVANISFTVDATPSAGIVPGRLAFITTDAAGVQQERLRITSKGEWGLAGANYGTSGQVLTSQGANAAPVWSTVTASASPAGPANSIQYNNSGVTGGEADLTWDATSNTLGLNGTDTGIVLTNIATEPAAPAAGTLRLYSKTLGGRSMLKAKGPSGTDYLLQPSIFQNAVYLWTPTTATAGLWEGTVGAGAGTYTTQLPTSTNIYTSTKRARWANVATTASQILGQRNTEAMFYRGAGVGGGFFFFARCGMDVWTNGGRFFAGMHTTTAVVTADPSALNNTVGFCVDAADNGAISFLTRGTAATKASTGFTLANNAGFDLFMFCAPNSSQITWRIVNINTGAEASGTATANLPANTTLLTAGVLASNAALTAVTSIQLGVSRIYIEVDY